ncbi:MAG: serine hydrolase domain-containing protein [Acidimicrobiales bacterium]
MTTTKAPTLTVSDPTSLGFDPERLERVDAFIQSNYLDTGLYPGFSLLVSRNGQIAHLSVQGHRNAETSAPMTEDTLVRIFSMTKPITSVAMLALYEEGLFRLEDPVSKFIPSFGDLRVWEDGNTDNYTTRHPEREVTIRDLFTHTSGLTYGFMKRHPVDSLYRRNGIDAGSQKLESWVDSLTELPLLFNPGSQWSYSVATDVLGRLVEVIGGEPFDRYLQRRIFDPLAMVDTTFTVADDDADRLASLYTVPSLSPFAVPEGADGDEKLLIDDGGPESQWRRPAVYQSGGGGLVSTIGDYHRFTQMLLNGGVLDGQRILGRKTLQYATTNHLPGGGDLASMGQAVFSETTYDGIGFGLGFSVVLDPAASQVIGSAGAYGWGGAASTLFWVDPAEDLAVIGLTQLMPSSAYPIREELRPLVYSALVD